MAHLSPPFLRRLRLVGNLTFLLLDLDVDVADGVLLLVEVDIAVVVVSLLVLPSRFALDHNVSCCHILLVGFALHLPFNPVRLLLPEKNGLLSQEKIIYRAAL